MDPATIEAPPAEARPAVEVETPPPPPPPPVAKVGKPAPAAGQTYTVQKGDTLYGLAKRFYGDGKLWTRIADANKDKIRNATTVPAGAVLVIPPK
jgi:nucleoid-associated protein YgaU